MAARPGESALVPHRALLGKVPDQQVAERAGVSRALVVNYRKKLGIPPYEGHRAGDREEADAASFRGRRSALDPYVHMLGDVPDSEIARLANVTSENVRTYRSRRGIPAKWGRSEGEPARAEAPLAAAPRAQAPRAEAPKVEAPKVEAPKVEAPKVEAPRVEAPVAAPRPATVVAPAAAPAAPVSEAAPRVDAPAADALASEAATAFLVVVDTGAGARSYALVARDIAEAAGTALARVAARHPDGAIRSIQRVAELLP